MATVGVWKTENAPGFLGTILRKSYAQCAYHKVGQLAKRGVENVRIECVVIDVCRIDRGLIGSSIELLNFLNHDPGDHMNKSELIEVIAKDAELSKAAAGSALDAAIAAIVKAVSKGDTVTLIGFGTFKSSKRAARTGRNPQTGKELKIAATTVPRFTAGAGFKTAVAGKKAAKKK